MSAHRFFSRYNAMFSNGPEKMRILESLKQVYTKEDVMNNQIITAFREHRFSLPLSPEATQYLFRYLKGEDNMVLLQIFNQHIQVKDNNNCHVEFQDGGYKLDASQLTSSSTTENKVSSLTSLKKSIHRVQNGPPCLSSISFYTFINTYQGLSSCTISPDKKVLCGGFEESCIKLWSLTPQLFSSRATMVDVAQIHLSGDYLEEETKKSHYEEMVKMSGHSGAVYKTCFTNDSRYLLSCSEDTTIRLWSMDTHTNIVKYSGHNYPVWDIAISDLGCYFASGSQDKTVRLWTTDRVFPLKTLVGHTLDVDCVQFHPNGSYIASGGGDKTVRLWSVQTGRTVRLLQGHRASVLALAFSPNGRYLASAGEDRRIRLWDIASGSLLKELKGHTDTIHSLCFNQDSSMLASGGLDCVLRIWDVKKGINSNVLSGSMSSLSSSDGHTSSELLGAFPTKSTTVQYMEYTKNNLLLAAGAIQS
ncbi:TAF5-like RNA polymerase II p300/CBP-associated factor-associated factor 65 kDa subunit 5L isoform X2 [Lineus longissimus]|uniref:TAF5-like RNA polymerase II p300/CBP-associated factor-associated factor 65 kDa subunit 5L isoform X2 n=1 Tax=Lineus longissimus TaxID=88925 RepID=UPI00315DEB78